MKKQKGITLVSLVVTIIVLIILAGVSINLTLGENGIITIVKKTKENTEIAQREEETKLNELYTQLETEEGTSSEISYDAIVFPNFEFKTWQNHYNTYGITSATLSFDGTINIVAKRESRKGGAVYFIIFNPNKPISLKNYNTITLSVKSELNTSWTGYFLVNKDTDLNTFEDTSIGVGTADVIDDKVLYRKDFSLTGNNSIDTLQDDISNYNDEYYIGAYFGGYAGDGFTQTHNLTLYGINLE